MATIKITITTAKPVDVEVTEKIINPELSRNQLIRLLKQLSTAKDANSGGSS